MIDPGDSIDPVIALDDHGTMYVDGHELCKVERIITADESEGCILVYTINNIYVIAQDQNQAKHFIKAVKRIDLVEMVNV